ncbi:CHAT domain-containing protein [Streptomyces griseus]|uniref:CHAT domain-containing protein n=1 Tax=Streptomyces griseus TaxID=1911 RepID=UPI000565CBA0|nr:CHAT domain-containing protein [Streptomyces griseus]
MEPGAPVQELFVLADRVTERIITLRFATTSVANRDWSALTEDDVRAACRLAGQVLDRSPERACVLAHLTLLAARARWGEDRDSPWWTAADVYVELARTRLERVADGDRLNHALAVVDRQIAILDDRIERLRRRRLSRQARALAASEEQERADTLQGAAALILGPYLANYDKEAVWERLAEWIDPVGPKRRTLMLGPDIGERHRIAQSPIRVSEDMDRAPMPYPVHAAESALAQLERALATARGHVRGLCLYRKVRALDFLRLLGENVVDFERRLLETAEEALVHLDAERAPEDRLLLLDLLVGYGARPAPRHLDELLPSPFDRLRDAHGPDRTLTTLIVTGRFIDRPALLAELQACAEEVLPDLSNRQLILSYYDMIVHRLPENRYVCQGMERRAGLAAVEEQLPQIDALGREEPAAAAATLLHLISHVRDADGAGAAALLAKVAELDSVYAEGHQWLMLHMAVSARRRYADALAGAGRVREAFLEYADIAEEQVRLLSHLRLPKLMRTFAQEVIGRFVPVEDAEDPIRVSALVLMALNPVVRTLTPSMVQGNEDFVHSLGLLADQELRAEDVPPAITFTHHCMFKGVDVGILLDNARPRRVGPASTGLMAEIRGREAALGPYVPPRIDELEETLDWVPSGMSALYYVTLGESAPDSTVEGSLRSLRQAFDRSVTRDLLGDLLTSDDPGLSTRHPSTELGRLRHVLPADTVLVSLFVGELAGTNTAEVPVNKACLTLIAVTADGCEGYLMRLDAVAGVVGMTSEDQLVKFHPLAADVANLRLYLNADGHSRPVGPHAGELLSRCYVRLGGPPAQALERWRSEGRRHLCFWPHGPLHYVPFHLLHHDGRPLADDWTVTTIPTTAVLGDPASPVAPRRIVIAGTRTAHPAFGLVEQAAVSEHVRNLAARVRPSRLMEDAEVTPASLLAAAEHATHLHIAAHGSHDAEAAWFQCLYLNPDPDNDGRLYAFQVAQADLSRLDLVTLSACESAMGRYDLNDNLRGLPAAFLLAGASTVIGALWPVTADVASVFFEELYVRLDAGEGKRKAFRAAQLTARERYPAYRLWGAFTFVGAWT